MIANEGQIDSSNAVTINGTSTLTLVGDNTLSSVTFNNTKANVNTQQGPIIGSRMVYEGQIRGESRVEFAQSAEAAAANASDAIESMRVPREYEAAVMKYFGALREKAEPAKDASEDKGE